MNPGILAPESVAVTASEQIQTNHPLIPILIRNNRSRGKPSITLFAGKKMTFYSVQQIVAEHPICTKQCARNEVGVGMEKEPRINAPRTGET